MRVTAERHPPEGALRVPGVDQDAVPGAAGNAVEQNQLSFLPDPAAGGVVGQRRLLHPERVREQAGDAAEGVDQAAEELHLLRGRWGALLPSPSVWKETGSLVSGAQAPGPPHQGQQFPAQVPRRLPILGPEGADEEGRENGTGWEGRGLWG